jgi:putative membrane protein
MMVKDHEKTVALFENAATNVKDPEIKAFAQQTLPVLKQHLASIQKIAAKLNIQTAP